MNKRFVFFLSILLLLSGCAAHKVDVPALEFGGTEGDASVLRLYFDGDSPVFLENGFTDLSALYVTGQYRHVFDLEVLETTDMETIYELPRSYDLLDNVTGILIYSDYAYAAVREDSNLRLHPLSPVRRRKLGRIFTPPRRAMPKRTPSFRVWKTTGSIKFNLNMTKALPGIFSAGLCCCCLLFQCLAALVNFKRGSGVVVRALPRAVQQV